MAPLSFQIRHVVAPLFLCLAYVPGAAAQENCDTTSAVLGVDATEEEIKCSLVASRAATMNRALTPVETEDVTPARFAVEFEFGSSELTDASEELLSTIATVISEDEDLKNSAYFIDGHTDAVGSQEANEKLGYSRAQSVAAFIIANIEDPLAVKIRSFGETKLLNPDAPNDGVNRRVEITPIADQ